MILARNDVVCCDRKRWWCTTEVRKNFDDCVGLDPHVSNERWCFAVAIDNVAFAQDGYHCTRRAFLVVDVSSQAST